MKRFDDCFSGDPRFNWDEAEGQEGMMETYGKHIMRVREQCKKHPLTVWSIKERDDGQYVIPCYSEAPDIVLYFVSKEERKEGDKTEYVWFLEADLD